MLSSLGLLPMFFLDIFGYFSSGVAIKLDMCDYLCTKIQLTKVGHINDQNVGTVLSEF